MRSLYNIHNNKLLSPIIVDSIVNDLCRQSSSGSGETFTTS